MTNYTNNYQLYKWDKTDEKLTTIQEHSNNADKIETALTNINAAVLEAKTEADAAVTTANNAKSTADGIADTANSAVTTANNAVTTANSAVTTANEASTTATDAKTTATTVQSQFNQVVAEAGSNNPEVVQARGTYDLLGHRMDNVDVQLSQMSKDEGNVKLADLSYLFNQDGKVSVITGDSLSFNQYDYDTGIGDAYNAKAGMHSWSFMVRDAIHRNDKFFVHGDELPFRRSKAGLYAQIAPVNDLNFAPFNGKYLDVFTTDPTTDITFIYRHYNRNSQKAVLYFLSNPNNTACSFDIYLNGTLATNVNLNGTGKLYQGYEMVGIPINAGAGATHEITLKNFVQTASSPDGTGKVEFQLLGIGTKYSPVYLTGEGSTTSAWLLSNITSKILQYNPNFVCIITGTNDLGGSVPVSTYQSNLQNIVSQIRAQNAFTQILLLGQGHLNAYADSQVQPYVDACKQVARDNNCYFLSLMDVFKNMNTADWQYDGVHMKKYGNTLLARSVLKTIMPNGLYPKDLVDAMLIQYNSYRFENKIPKIKGYANIKYNSTSGGFDIISQSDNSPLLSVTKVTDYKIQLNFKYEVDITNMFAAMNIPVLIQTGSVSQLLLTNLYSVALNTVTYTILKSSGTAVSATDYTNAPNDFNFTLSF